MNKKTYTITIDNNEFILSNSLRTLLIYKEMYGSELIKDLAAISTGEAPDITIICRVLTAANKAYKVINNQEWTTDDDHALFNSFTVLDANSKQVGTFLTILCGGTEADNKEVNAEKK